tara:strand:- start:141 stop:938 length:798 start_codon:yes stop_codon:yes gene_type:complete
MKKGQIYFSWIFIVIVGAIILTFFVGFAVKYKDLQEKKTEIIMLNSLDTALTNLQSSSFTTSTSVNLPLGVNVNCDEGDFSIFINEKNSVNHLLASESNLRDKMYVWYQPYEIPFRVANFYYLVDEDGVTIQTNNPDIINVDLIENGNMPDNFKDKIRIVESGAMKEVNINGNVNKGTVTINGGPSLPYIGKEMLLAAIFSDNYACFSVKVQEEIDKSILIYKHKDLLLDCDYDFVFRSLGTYEGRLNADQLHRDRVNSGCHNLF